MKKKILCIVLIAALIIGAGVLIAVKSKSSKGEVTQEAAFDIEYSDRLDGVPATDTSSNSSSIEVTYGDAGFTRKTLGVADNSDKRPDLKEESEQAVGEYNVTFLGKNGKIYVPGERMLFLYHNPDGYIKREAKIIKNRMLIHADNQRFNMQDIDNRRFMYNPITGVLLLSAQFPPSKKLRGSHAEDLSNAGIYSGYDDYVRGWIGTGKEYPHGIIHFAPNVDDRNTALFNRAFETLEMFAQNGAEAETVVRSLGKRWEQPLFSVLTDLERKPSIHEQLKQQPVADSNRQKQTTKKKEAAL